MERLEKKIVVSGHERVLFSMDGRAWFLKPESMHEFERSLKLAPGDTDVELDDSGIDMDIEMDVRIPLQHSSVNHTENG